MRHFLLLTAALLLISLTGCNLGNVAETEEPIEPTAPPTVEPAGRPTVTIISPSNGDEFEVNKPILVSVNATDSAGVTGIQLVVNGAIVKRVSSNSPTGDRNFPTVLDYTPRATGEVNLQVLAFRGATASDPAALAIEVVPAAGTGSNTGSNTGNNGGSGTGSSGVIIPNDGVCRALTSTNLNLRRLPINGEVMTVLPASTLAPVVARLGDNTWWKVNTTSGIGWISAQFSQLSGNCFNVPIETLATATPTPTTRPAASPTFTPTATATLTPQPGTPDLLVTAITPTTEVTLSGSPVTLTYGITVSNLGQGPAGSFKVTLAVNNTQKADWVVSGLGRGESVALTTDLKWDAAGTYNIRVDADPDNAVREVSDINNRGDVTITVKP